MLDFLNESPFNVYLSVESPKVTRKINLPLGDIDLPDDLYISNNGILQAKDIISPENNNEAKFIMNNTEEHLFNNNLTTETTTETTTNTTKGNTKGNAKKALNFFMSKGLSKHLAAGIVGNLMGESNLNPDAVNPTSKAYGIALWLGDRKKKLFAKYGNKPTLDLLLDFVWEELNTSEKRSFNKLLQTQSIEEATNSFMKHFERPSSREMALSIKRRIEFSKMSLLS